jgi:subtilisin family serine protease
LEKHILSVLLFFNTIATIAQDNYWIIFKNRDLGKKDVVSQKTLQNRINLGLEKYQVTDFGPFEKDIEKLFCTGIKKRQISKWFNAVSVQITNKNILHEIQNWDEVKEIIPFEGFFEVSQTIKNPKDIKIGFGIAQMGFGHFLEKQLKGQGVDVGVIDGGFLNANTEPMLSHLFNNQQVIKTRDFFFPDKKDFYGEKKSEQEFHGTAVMTFISGLNTEKLQVTGMATGANFYLGRTESSTKEARIEEDHWIAAIEWLDSLGVRLVNSSLGYAQGFTNPSENYHPNQMDGKTSLIARGAAMATKEKGMIIVTSAGNEGENKIWGGIVSTPGDVEEVISVGANDDKGLKMAYSSKGNEEVLFVKPDVTAYSEYGTSFAAPLITGFVACLLQQYPNLKSDEIKEVLQISADMTTTPNNYIGAGYPQAEVALKYLESKSSFVDKPIKIVKRKKAFSIIGSETVPVFHLKDSKNVLMQELSKPIKNESKVFKPLKAIQSVLILKDQIIIVNWKN